MLGHIADVHLGARLKGFEELEDDVEHSFGAAVESLVREGAEAIVVSGDLFDKPKPSNRAIRAAVRVIRWAAVERGVPVLLVLGDHDYPQRGDHSPVHVVAEAVGSGVYVSPERFSPGATALDIVSSSTVEVGGASFTLLPFVKAPPARRAEVTGRLLEAASRLAPRLRRPRVLAAHLGLKGYTFEDDASAEPAQLPPYEYAALGHIHRRVVERIPLPGGETVIAYPSSLVPLKADEVREHMKGGRRGPLLVDLSGDEPVIHELEFEQPRLQVYLEVVADSPSELLRRAREVLAAHRAAGGARRPVVHLSLLLGPTSPLTPREAVSLLERRLGVIVRLSSIKRLSSRAREQAAIVGGDEVGVLRSLLDPRNRYPEASGRLAALIAAIKSAAARGDLEEVESLLSEAFSSDFDAVWREALSAAPRGGGGISRWLG